MSDAVIISACCVGHHCRYNGKGYMRKVAERIQEIKIPVCPEVHGGLSIPREGCSVQKDGTVIGRRTGTDYTQQYRNGALFTLELCKERGIKRAYLLKNSPSCGRGYGLTAKLLEANGIRVTAI